ncbi:ring-hydroxylating dioxygenase subunit beta [Conexibacter sp. W3-3-2]|uniref:Ring-hydroxylating dioxygenase subunit beta n=1 Tax=Paraconexibacter algicola TaxID=2133960 RepID=A0A2T4UGN1_9ACTN|nr:MULTISPECIES: aromatic-ring-hydroxylating dioxygenase subunit beta [Solirubrobacterales]MTD44673.1 ring-hydroxylating dioxygenase subunit beta [Conexibacter sp. W3-3-2]PTL58414.1 ring-hydroxylating dioxygenase subunit beta [Paraconexibacter algicola]
MSTALDLELLKAVEQFVYREARYADEHEYDAWEALWTDDAIYWVPANGADIDPTRQMSVLYDNRARIATRIKQLHTGKRHAQIPRSDLRRIVSNVELLEAHPELPDDVHVGANVLVCEARERGTVLWAGRTTYVLRDTPDGLRMARKKVVLVDNERPLHTLAFLI